MQMHKKLLIVSKSAIYWLVDPSKAENLNEIPYHTPTDNLVDAYMAIVEVGEKELHENFKKTLKERRQQIDKLAKRRNFKVSTFLNWGSSTDLT